MDEAYLRDKLDRIAEDGAVTRTKVEAFEEKLEKGEKHFEKLETRVGKLETWRSRILGALAVFTGLGLLAAKYLPWIKSGGGG